MAQAPSRSALLRTLRESANRFDAESSQRKREALQRLMALPLAADAALADYHDTLLFIAAHPPDEAVRGMVERELRRLAVWLKARRGRHLAAWADRGMPWVDTVTRFTHDCVRWLWGTRTARSCPIAMTSRCWT